MYVLSLNDGFVYLHSQLRRLEYIHSRNYIHRDLKPSNIAMGLGVHSNVVYLIDFGLSKEYRDPITYKHIPSKTSLGLTGTATFASINSHLGLELGRRDDLESLAYVLIYFLRGSLPWQHLSGSKDIVKHKRARSSKLCHGLLAEFSIFLEYSRSLGFEDKPDYGYINDIFKNLSSREGLQDAVAFDWGDWDGADEQPQSPASNDPVDRAVGQRRREGYAVFVSFTPYMFTSSCLGCAPSCVNVNILRLPLPPVIPALLPLDFYPHSYHTFNSVCACSLTRFENGNGYRAAVFVEVPKPKYCSCRAFVAR